MLKNGYRVGQWGGSKCLGAVGEWETTIRIYCMEEIYLILAMRGRMSRLFPEEAMLYLRLMLCLHIQEAYGSKNVDTDWN